jgi:DNA replicative helicase MCM subunit Mcm2 (Cdc46/Mcm family)
MRLSETVDEEDAKAAIDVFNRALNAVATDPVTGKLDIDRVTNVSNYQSRNITDAIINSIKHIGGDFNVANEGQVFERMTGLGYDAQRVRRTIDGLLKEGKLMAPKNGVLKVM